MSTVGARGAQSPVRSQRTWATPAALASSRWTGALVVAAITLVGLALRLPSFGDSLFGDELGAYFVSTGHGLGRVIYLTHGHSTELNPPLWFALAWLTTQLVGVSAPTLKLVSLLAGTATIPLTYLLGRWTVGARAGLAGAALAALSPFLIFYSTEARPYGLLVLLCLVSTLCLVRGVGQGASSGWWVGYALAACAAMYTHFTCVFLLVAQAAWALVAHPRARRALILASAAAVLGFAPWIPQLIRTARSPGTKLYGALETFDWHTILVDVGHWGLGHPYQTLTAVPGTTALVLIAAGAAVGLVGVVRSVAAGARLHRAGALIIVAALAAPIGNALYSALATSVWQARNIITSWPAAAVLFGALLTAGRRGTTVAACALALAGFGLGALRMTEAAHQRPDYRAAAADIDRDPYPAAPVVELVAPTPGPYTATEVALALAGSRGRHPVLRLGFPTRAASLAAPPYAPLPVDSGQTVARQAAGRAGRGALYLVAATTVPIASLQSLRHRGQIVPGKSALALFINFLVSLPPRFQPVAQRSWPGFLGLSVYEFRGS